MRNKRQTATIAAVVLVILALIAGAIFLFRTQNPQDPMTQIPVSTSTAEAASSTAATAASTTTAPLSQSTPETTAASPGMRLYKNAAFHFSLTYPNTLQATEYQEAGGALTASFQNPSTEEGFEVYVTPYSGTQISQARFKLDEPSGTFENPTAVVIDGVNATMFYGYNPIMGDTREVWLIHDGFLYEIATYKALDTWLAGIMQTWQFI